MNFALAFPLVLAVLSRGHSSVTVTKEGLGTCFEVCPPGYHKTVRCSGPTDGAPRLRCEKCGENSFTAINNTSPKCERCRSCGTNQDVIKPCAFNSNVACDCKSDYYNANPSPSGADMNCRLCRMQPGRNRRDTPDYIRKCKPCERPECLQKPECRSQYGCGAAASAPPASTASTSATAPFRNATAATSWTSAVKNPDGDYVSWLVWLAVTFAAVSGLLLLRRLFGAPESCLYWRIQKAVTHHKDEPRPNEQHSHQDNASIALTINACEETPMMSLSQSPSTSEHPAPAGVLLPSSEPRVQSAVSLSKTSHTSSPSAPCVAARCYSSEGMRQMPRKQAAKQDEQSKDWPAIVLYAIIKEVPLRRWKEFLRLLSVADEQLERVELEAGLGPGSMERQYQMLRLWSQRASASLDDVFSALNYMDLSRRAQLLEENLENLPWTTETQQGLTA